MAGSLQKFGEQILSFNSTPPPPPPHPPTQILSDTVNTVKERNDFFYLSEGMENCKMSGKIREKSGNFEVDDKLQPWLAFAYIPACVKVKSAETYLFPCKKCFLTIKKNKLAKIRYFQNYRNLPLTTYFRIFYFENLCIAQVYCTGLV